MTLALVQKPEPCCKNTDNVYQKKNDGHEIN